ncbi:MAG: DUF3014 domain-containing protein [Motiliproteus sp.]|nr:DUF3014 domain-containing protein [Motiliproteus sp.]MCW9053942.1 DUF3014 domain-containing protein [Motiliproteus sp.]
MFAVSNRQLQQQKGNTVIRFLGSLIMVAMLGAVAYLMLLRNEPEYPAAASTAPVPETQSPSAQAPIQIDESQLSRQQLMSLKRVEVVPTSKPTRVQVSSGSQQTQTTFSGIVNQAPAQMSGQTLAALDPESAANSAVAGDQNSFSTLAGSNNPGNASSADTRGSASPKGTAKPVVKKLPPLDSSDKEIREVITSLDSTMLLADWLIDEELVRKFVVLIDNMAEGQIPSKHSVIRPLNTSFRAVEQGDQLFLGGYNFSRYTTYIDLLSVMDSQRLSALYQRYYPLLQQAYGELGYSRKSFHKRLLMAIDHLIDSPIQPGTLELERPSVMFKYADPELEQLSDAHKQMLRMGPENSRKLIGQLTILRSNLIRVGHG